MYQNFTSSSFKIGLPPAIILFLLLQFIALLAICAGKEDVCDQGDSSCIIEKGEQQFSSFAAETAYKMNSAVRPFILKSTEKCTGLVIFLHGLGDTGYGWSESFNALKKEKHIRYVFPNAPTMPVTINMGANMPSWFDISSLDMSGTEDKEGITKARNELVEFIKKEQQEFNLSSDRIVIGGFSMGGALALYTALKHEEKLAGVICLSSWLPLRNEFIETNVAQNFCSPVFQGHGKADLMVNEHFGKTTHEALKRFTKSKADYKTYEGMGHESCDTEMKDVKTFIHQVLPPI